MTIDYSKKKKVYVTNCPCDRYYAESEYQQQEKVCPRCGKPLVYLEKIVNIDDDLLLE